MENYRVQNENGVDYIPLLSSEQLRQQFPYMNTDDLKLGAFALPMRFFDQYFIFTNQEKSYFNGCRVPRCRGDWC